MSEIPIHSLALFGGSGATGQQVIQQAAALGLRIRTLVRPATVGSFQSEPSNRVEIWEGSLLNEADVENLVKGCDAVWCVFGPRPPFTDLFCTEATRLIISAMQRYSVTRLVCQTGAMIGEYRHNRTWPFQILVNLFQRSSPELAEDRATQESLVRSSNLAWTLVKPPRLTHQPKRGEVVVGPDVKVGLGSQISRADLAEFLLRELFFPEYLAQAVFIRHPGILSSRC